MDTTDWQSKNNYISALCSSRPKVPNPVMKNRGSCSSTKLHQQYLEDLPWRIRFLEACLQCIEIAMSFTLSLRVKPSPETRISPHLQVSTYSRKLTSKKSITSLASEGRKCWKCFELILSYHSTSSEQSADCGKRPQVGLYLCGGIDSEEPFLGSNNFFYSFK